MTIATTDRPIRTNMGRQEAEKITAEIRSSFDSLGKKLIEIRERKGYLALGYQSLETYCLTEFGKGRSRVYQLIEEATIEQGIVNELAASDSPIKSLNMPGTYLRELKDLETPQQQIEAIAYANKLAKNEGKTKATKVHLQVAVHTLSQRKPEQTKQIIKTIGFDKGVEVEIIEGRAKGQRGVIRKIDKKGVHVELYTGNSTPILLDVSDLKVVLASEKPQHPTTIDGISIGDKVHIFSSNNKGKTGEIIARVNDKLALVEIEGHKAEIPYAELERIYAAVENDQPPPNDSIWAGKWNKLSSWYYNAKDHQIHSFGCPNLILQIPEKCSDPSEWLENWRKKNLKQLIEAFFTKDDIALLTATSAAESLKKAEKELSELRLRLTEAETTIGKMIQTATSLAEIPEPAQAEVYFLPGGYDISNPDIAVSPDILVEGDKTENLACEIEIKIEEELSPAIAESLKKEWEKAEKKLYELQKTKDEAHAKTIRMNRKERERLNKDIKRQQANLYELEKFAKFRVGQTICHKRNPLILGKIIKLGFSQGGMPFIWVRYYRDGEFEKIPTSELVNMIFTVNI